jgi:hypothetical protein
VFLYEICSTFVFPLFVSKVISTQISINLLDCSRLHMGFLSDILTWYLFWGPKEKRKAYWKFPGLIYQQILLMSFKMNSGELKMRFLPTAPIHILLYILNIFDYLEVSKRVLIWNIFYICVPLICFKNYQHPNFYQITRL